MRSVAGNVAFAAIVAVSFVAFGCSGESEEDDVGSSGVPGGKYLDELTPDEQRRLCEWAIPAVGGPGEKTCSEEMTTETATVEECASGDLSGLHCTVATLEACVRGVEGDACRLATDDACTGYRECVVNAGGV